MSGRAQWNRKGTRTFHIAAGQPGHSVESKLFLRLING